MALETLSAAGILYAVPRSKSWSEFEADDSPTMDLIVTVCDNAAGETCPIWPGHPITAHWPFPDPAKFYGSTSDRIDHFRSVFVMIRARIDEFLEQGTV